MRVLVDACVLYPTVMREVVLGLAQAGCFEVRWSARIMEEWALAARKLGPAGEVQARGEIAQVQARFPGAMVAAQPGLEARLWLPDPADVHVLAAAVAGSADMILTANAKDFPRGILAEEGVERCDADQLALRCLDSDPDMVAQVAGAVLAEARLLSGQDWTLRGLLKKARMPRLGKALA